MRDYLTKHAASVLWLWINEPLIWICGLKLTCGLERSVFLLLTTAQMLFLSLSKWSNCSWISNSYDENVTLYLNWSLLVKPLDLTITFSFYSSFSDSSGLAVVRASADRAAALCSQQAGLTNTANHDAYTSVAGFFWLLSGTVKLFNVLLNEVFPLVSVAQFSTNVQQKEATRDEFKTQATYMFSITLKNIELLIKIKI